LRWIRLAKPIIAAVPILTWYWLATYDARKDDDDEV
jgi:hypothetical protein